MENLAGRKESYEIEHQDSTHSYDETKRKPTCFNRWMNFHNIFGYLK